MEEKSKRKITKHQIFCIICILVVLIVIGTVVIFIIHVSKEEKYRVPEIITVNMNGKNETQYAIKIKNSEKFIDKIAWIYYNDYELVNDAYPKMIYFTAEGDCIQTSTVNNSEEYVDELLEIKYNDDKELYDKCVPKLVIYKDKIKK